MQQVRSDSDASQNHDEKQVDEQFPVDTRVITTIRFHADGFNGDLIRIIVMNDQATSHCSAYSEYYYGNNAASIEDVKTFIMNSSTVAGTQQYIDEFVGSMPLHIQIPQLATWHCGVYTPSETRKRLYKAIDPDDSTKMIGLLLEQDSSGRLVRITWYKTQQANVIFRSTPEALRFEVVEDEEGAPSLDPNDIGGWTWHYTTSLGHCSFSQRLTE